VVHLSASGRKDLLKDVYASLAPASRPYPPFPPAPPDASAAATTPGAVPTANLLSVGEARPPRRLSRSGGGGGGGGGGAAHPRDEELVMLERICVERKCDDSLITLYSLLPVDQWAPRPHDPLASNAAASADEAATFTDEGNETSAASAATVNKRAACLTGQEVHGDVLVLHAYVPRFFFYVVLSINRWLFFVCRFAVNSHVRTHLIPHSPQNQVAILLLFIAVRCVSCVCGVRWCVWLCVR